MFLKLRILFTILSAICLVVIIPVAVWGGFVWFFIVGGGALLFFALVLLCKQAQEKKEGAKNKPTTDFLSPDPAANEKVNAEGEGKHAPDDYATGENPEK